MYVLRRGLSHRQNYRLFVTKVVKNKKARGVSRVLYRVATASAIYPARRSPAGSSATYPPTRTGRPSETHPGRCVSTSVYMVLQPAVRTATGVAAGTGGLLPRLFTLTPAV